MSMLKKKQKIKLSKKKLLKKSYRMKTFKILNIIRNLVRLKKINKMK